MIDDIIRTAARDTQLSESQVRSALASALGLLEKHGDRDKVAALYAAVPGAEALAKSPEARIPAPAGVFGGLMHDLGGSTGAAVADATATMDKAAKAGVDRSKLKALLKSVEGQIAQGPGPSVLRDAFKSIPGVGALLAK
jgi:hypothetical protein